MDLVGESWASFSDSAPELADAGKRLLEDEPGVPGVAFLATDETFYCAGGAHRVRGRRRSIGGERGDAVARLFWSRSVPPPS